MTAATNFLAFLVLLAALFVLWRQSRPGRVRLFAAQSACLTVLAAVIATFSGHRDLFGVAAAFAIVKVIVIPKILSRIVLGGPARPARPGRSAGLALLAGGALIVASYVIMLPVTRVTSLPTAGAIPLAFASTLIGLFICVTGRDAFTQVLGFLVLENGIFALALLGAYGLPLLVEAGVFLDVLVIVLIMEGGVVQLRREHASLDVDRLRELRG
jgi:hydrogenase-4 component E